MIKKLLITTALIISAGSCFGQWVYKDAKNRIVLDCSAKTGYPQTGVVKVINRAGIQTLNSSVWMFSNRRDTSYVKTSVVAERLDINSGVSGPGARNIVCGGAWRYPTPQEYALIAKFEAPLVSLGMTRPSNSSYAWLYADVYDYYNAGAGDNTRSMLGMQVSPGLVTFTSGPKSSDVYFGRCVREITD